MRIDVIPSAIMVLSLVSLSGVSIAQDSDLEQLRMDVKELRSDYESRIAELERRLAIAEQNSMQASNSNAAPIASVASGNSAFNPAIGVIFSGNLWNYGREQGEYSVQGFPYGGEAGPISEGLSLGETEIIMNANVDDKFTAWLTAALAIEDGEAVVEIEEAWIETTALPGGFSARMGKFFSGIGYLNEKHAHSWDFADQPLPYQAFLAGQLSDTGVQLRWLAPTDTYIEIGGEAFRGDSYPFTGAAHNGIGAYSLFTKIGGDLSDSSSWLAGVSYLDSSATERPSGDEEDPLLFSGDSDLLAAQFVWKWSRNGNWRDRHLVVQAEYFQRREDGSYSGSALSPSDYRVDQDGWYVQAVYQPRQRWRVGGRFDTLSSDSPGPAFDATPLERPESDPRRFSLMADWANSEFSRFRLQFTRDETGPFGDNQWGLQYFLSIGAHGAHSF